MFDLRPLHERLFHDSSDFSADQLRARAAAMGFTQATEVEAFAWVLELYGQIQNAAGQIPTRSGAPLLLKGGTAVQLYLPVEQQRASVDLDLLAFGDPAMVKATLAKVSQRLASGPYFILEEYAPKRPQPGLPLQTFFVTVPSLLGMTAAGPLSQIAGRAIKLDILYVQAPLPVATLERPRTFALNLAYAPRCLGLGPLIGDKLLTLATRSIGIPPVRAADLPKHLYDLDNLTRLPLGDDAVASLLATLPSLVKTEAAPRAVEVSPSQALQHVEETLLRLAALDLRQGAGDLKQHVLNMQSQYLRAPMRVPFHGWAIKALRLRFFVGRLTAALRDERLDVAGPLRRADALADYLGFASFTAEDRRRKRQAAQELLLSVLKKAGQRDWKELKPRPPERLFWAALGLESLDHLEELLRQNL